MAGLAPVTRTPQFGFAAAWLALLLSGCGGGGKPAKSYSGSLVPIKGVVTLDGEPVADASVVFVFDGTAPSGFLSSSGKTDSSGKYQLKTGGQAGTPPGRYRVSIEKWATANGEPIVDDPANGMDMAQSMTSGALKQLIPAKYNDTTKGKLTVEVSEGQTDPVDFALKSK